MKISDLQGFPEKKDDRVEKLIEMDDEDILVNAGFNRCRRELGELEVSLDVGHLMVVLNSVQEYRPEHLTAWQDEGFVYVSRKDKSELAKLIANSKEVVRIKGVRDAD